MRRAQRFSGIRLVASLLLAIGGITSVHAQDAASPKFTLSAGPGMVAAQGTTRGEIRAGASIEEAPPNTWTGFSLEGGYLGPWTKPHSGSAFLSADFMASWSLGQSGKGRTANGTPYWADLGWKFIPFAATGYTRLFGTGNAVNFGGGFDYRLSQTQAIRVEVRDYYSFSTPAQHNLGLRFGYIVYLWD